MQPKEGLRVRLLQDMDDPYAEINAGEEGTIKFVDDAGHIHVSWDMGSNLSVLPERDSYEIFELKKGLLDFSGMTPEKIEEFIYNTELSYEVDGTVATSIDENGYLHEGQMDCTESTNWLIGIILGRDINANIGLCLVDAYAEALRAFKQNDFNLEKAAEIFEEVWGPLQ